MITIKKDQNGLVSIMVASILMVLMALITLGFTRVVQNEQRQALDNQLSRQAFYAAESGINVAASAPGFPGVMKDTCDVSDEIYDNGVISAATPEVAFTCILINPTPVDLVFNNDSVTTNKSRVVPLKTPPTTPPAKITFQWSDSSLTGVEADCNGNLRLDTSPSSWRKVSLLKVDLIGVPNTPFGRQELIDSQFSVILYPCGITTPSEVEYTTAKDVDDIGRIVPANCGNTGQQYQCQITISGLPNTYSVIYARFNAIYGELNVRITATDASNSSLLFSDAQAVVDSTGRASDVFQRLQARVPLYNNYNLPIASIQTVNDVCKLYQVRANEVIDGCN